MFLKSTLFQSKVARRMTLLFLFSALLPIVLLTVLTFSYFTDHFMRQNQVLLHEITKNISMGIVDELNQFEIELNHVATEIDARGDYKKHSVINPDDYLSQYFQSFAIETYSSETRNPQQTVLENGWLTSEDLTHLRKGMALIRTTKFNDPHSQIFMITALDKDKLDTGLLVGEIKKARLWHFDHTLPSAADVCVYNVMFEPLYCSEPATDIEALSKRLASIDPDKSQFEWTQHKKQYIAYHWGLFLQGAYRSPQWIVVLNKRKSDIYSTFNQFKSIYPGVILVSVLLIAVLSSTQIRRYLVPLELLKKATREIAKGNFKNQVNLKSGDEFEQLAEAYNDMSRKLDIQFKSLAIMAKVDHSILTSLDADYIIETVLNGIRELVPHSDVNILSLDKQDHPTINKHAIKTTLFSQHKLIINRDEERILKANTHYLAIKPGYTAPDFLANMPGHGNNHVVIFPLFLKKDLIAVVVLRHEQALYNPEGTYSQVRELIDRIAVALTNASWEGKLYQQVNFDSLTLLPNRTLLQDRLEQAIKRAHRANKQIAVVFLDIDRFKAINDSLGYKAGDTLIKEVAQRLSEIAETVDSFGRYGSDEFLFIMSDISYNSKSISSISIFVEDIMRSVSKPFVIDAHEINVSASIGIALNPSDAKKPDQLINFAEIAMHHAKSQGKGSYHFYSKDINAQSFAMLLLENDLRRALERDELEIHYQPQFDAHSFKLVGAEALLRWHHPKMGLLHPGQFIELANESGLMVGIGEWVIRNTCKQLKAWIVKGQPLVKISVNLSTHQFREHNLVALITSCVKEHQVDPRYLEFEITEDTLMSDIDKAISILHELKSIGFQLAVDDFGTGYSTLNYLAKFPIHCLKIDQSFVHDMMQEKNVASIVSAIIALGHSLNLTVIAEGIETGQQLTFLQNQHCDILQGYMLGRPVPATEFAKLLLANDLNTARHAT